jgi:hypothetical protein
MASTLELKRWPEFRNYEILPEGLRIEFKAGGSYSQQTVKFEDIGFEIQLLRYKPSVVAISLFVSIAINILLVILLLEKFFPDLNQSLITGLIISTTVIMLLWARRLFKFDKEKFLLGVFNIPFWYFERYQPGVDRFIADLKTAKNGYFRKKYFKLEDDDDFQSYKDRLIWLKTEGYISDEEYKQALAQSDFKKQIKGF